MNTASAMRLVAYALGLLAALGAAWAASQGLGTYDPATGTFDPAPFRIEALVGVIVSGLTNGLAAIALWRGWGRK